MILNNFAMLDMHEAIACSSAMLLCMPLPIFGCGHVAVSGSQDEDPL